MEFGIFNSLYVPKQTYEHETDQWAVESQRLQNEIAWTIAADRSGFKYTWATEHHFLTEYSHLSANECFLPYIAARTERIHVGTGIFNITPPVNHPARVAERVAMIDQLSGGRFEFGMGRGSSSTEQRGFGINDPAETIRMVDEVLPQFKHMWAENEYRFDGEFFSMPPRNVLPKPARDPHPPMWIAAGNPGTFEKAARMGLGVLCFTTGSPETLAPLVETYKKEIVNAEPVGEYVNDNIMVTSQLPGSGRCSRSTSRNRTSSWTRSSLASNSTPRTPRSSTTRVRSRSSRRISNATSVWSRCGRGGWANSRRYCRPNLLCESYRSIDACRSSTRCSSRR